MWLGRRHSHILTRIHRYRPKTLLAFLFNRVLPQTTYIQGGAHEMHNQSDAMDVDLCKFSVYLIFFTLANTNMISGKRIHSTRLEPTLHPLIFPMPAPA
ncbi:hypothetical protein BT96DRAFT_99556 [Gymnopus androsaceus JB14]|uniref:Uncharacterized protein n=1 Tax=Gymnopus androsaceus JB14 TaxID=1447944 RepID=A0A6A4HFY5_9AGAR|nr:hypothetical protein BT96DRAFT_99556 [Gymnopus androsaceus JB14]